MAKKILLVRHGEPEVAYLRKFLGRLNPGLSPNGREQAKLVAERVREYSPDRLFSSPLRRAYETAEIIGGICGLPVETNDMLLEIDFGLLEGKSHSEASVLFPGITDSWQALSGDFAFPEGEAFCDFNRRTAQLTEKVRNCPEETILLVAHGGVLRGVMCNLLDLPANGPLRFRLAYASIASLEVNEKGPSVLTGFNVGRDTPMSVTGPNVNKSASP